MPKKEDLFLSDPWKKNHIEKTTARAGKRYNPEINVDLPIKESLETLIRSPRFIQKFHTHLSELRSKLNYLEVDEKYKRASNHVEAIKELTFSLIETLSTLKDIDSPNLPLKSLKFKIKKIFSHSNKLSSELIRIDRKLRLKPEIFKNEYHRERNDDLERSLLYLNRFNGALYPLEDFVTSTDALLVNRPFLILSGKAGNGKTHLLCDFVCESLNSDYPAAMVFSEYIDTTKDISIVLPSQIDNRLQLKSILRKLNEDAKKRNIRALVAIDALNETHSLKYWRDNLLSLKREIQEFKYIALVVSIRSGFEGLTLPKSSGAHFSNINHEGFKFKEWDAVTKFFLEFNIPSPEIPILTAEFQNPLFLLMFCKAFEDRKKENKKSKREKQVFRGHEGWTFIFENFVKSISRKIEKKYGLSSAPKNNIWDKIIEEIARKMVETNESLISFSELQEIVSKFNPDLNSKDLIKDLERNYLIEKRIYQNAELKDEYFYRFTFQRFSDHLIARYIFKSYFSSYRPKKLADKKKFAKHYFSKKGSFGKFLATGENQGIVEALLIQSPEFLTGIEFFEVAPYVEDFYNFPQMFADSIIGRNPRAFSKNMKTILKCIDKYFYNESYDLKTFLNTLICVAPIPNHPMNARFLHDHLISLRMPQRDAVWSTFLHYEFGEKNALDRIIEWAWQNKSHKELNKEAIFLSGIVLTWLFTTPNRFVRDKATKALINLIGAHSEVQFQLLKLFENVDDEYVVERLYGAVYGALFKTKIDSNVISIAEWIFKEKFRKINTITNILTRDYIIRILELIASKTLKLSFDKKSLKPPYKSKFNTAVPSVEKLKSLYGINEFYKNPKKGRGCIDIWASVMYQDGSLADFGNYVVNSKVRKWTSTPLKTKKPSLIDKYEKFKAKLGKTKLELLKLATSKSHVLDIHKSYFNSKGELEVKGELRDDNLEKETRQLSLSLFLSMLSSSQRRIFLRDFLPNLDDQGNIPYNRKTFDGNLAQRWIFKRVMELGWNEEEHLRFDEFVNRVAYERTSHKSERIGKKYQWIALYELLGAISDNYRFDREFDEEPLKYFGAWQADVRNIDPSQILRNIGKSPSCIVDEFDVQPPIYKTWIPNSIDTKWLSVSTGLPPVASILNPKSSSSFLCLDGFFEWYQPLSSWEQSNGVPRRKLFYIIKSHLVSEANYNKHLKHLKSINLQNQRVGEPYEIRDIFLGEYPNSDCFREYERCYLNSDVSILQSKDKVRTMPIATKYFDYSSDLDCSTEEDLIITLPNPTIFRELGLNNANLDGRLYDKNSELVSIAPNVFYQEFPDSLYMRKDRLMRFLKAKKIRLVWTLIGEKQVIDSPNNIFKGRLNISGIYSLSDTGTINGRRITKFISPNSID